MQADARPDASAVLVDRVAVTYASSSPTVTPVTSADSELGADPSWRCSSRDRSTRTPRSWGFSSRGPQDALVTTAEWAAHCPAHAGLLIRVDEDREAIAPKSPFASCTPRPASARATSATSSMRRRHFPVAPPCGARCEMAIAWFVGQDTIMQSLDLWLFPEEGQSSGVALLSRAGPRCQRSRRGKPE